MAGTSARRPIPALIFLLILSLLSGLVWWRVLHRPDSGAASGPKSSSCSAASATAVAWPKPATVTVTVLNATNRAGLAHDVAGQLKGRGFRIGPIGNDPATSTATQVRYGTNSATAARLVQLYLPGSQLVATTGDSRTVVVAVGRSYKALATAKQVDKARSTPVKNC